MSPAIGPRSVPPPDGASHELRAILTRSPAPQQPEPASEAEWREQIAAADRDRAAVARDAAAATGVRIERDVVAGVPVHHVVPPRIAPEHEAHLFVHVHGGGFVRGAGLAGTGEAVAIAARIGIPVLSVDYRMPPDHPAPAAADDVLAVWRATIERRPARSTALGGSSAGANLTLVVTLRSRELGLELPGALFVGTPPADLTARGDSHFTNAGIDRQLVRWQGAPARSIASYVGDGDVDDPELSPVLADVTGFPPTYLVSGTRDLLLSDTVRTHRRLRRAGVVADLHVYEGMSHAEYALLAGTPESAEHHAELKAFLLAHLSRA